MNSACIFWSYAHLDDKEPRKLSVIRDAFRVVIDQTLGFKSTIIFDSDKLMGGDKWETKLMTLVYECDIFMPIMSPSYFNSKNCIRELFWAIDKKKTILPFYLKEPGNGLTSSFKDDGGENSKLNDCSRSLNTIHYLDYRALKNKTVDTEVVQDWFDASALNVRECLKRESLKHSGSRR